MDQPRRVLAVASGGGHWKQLRRLEPLLRDMDTRYVSIDPRVRVSVSGRPFYSVADASRAVPARLIRVSWQMLRIVWRERPDIVITTGAAPGLIALIWGKLLGARTIWIDSLANADRLSLSGRLAKPFSDLHLTQWQHLANGARPRFLGTVL